MEHLESDKGIRTDAIPDLQAAIKVEKDIEEKKQLQRKLIFLKEMVGALK